MFLCEITLREPNLANATSEPGMGEVGKQDMVTNVLDGNHTRAVAINAAEFSFPRPVEVNFCVFYD